MEDRNVIRIAIMGGTSCGKSTFMNALFTKQYSDMKIRRTTMLPQIYIETNNIEDCADVKDIYKINQKINNDIVNGEVKLTNENCIPIPHFVPKINGFIDIPDNVFLEVYDIPGLDDGETKPIYFKWINDNFHKFDLIFFIVDIERALNTSDERDILNLIADNISKNPELNIELVTLVNKCDDMFYKDDMIPSSYFSFGKTEQKVSENTLCMDEEYTEMFDQIREVLKKTSIEKQVKLGKYKFPISAEDAFIYRMYKDNPTATLDIKFVNKFGINEHGKSKWKKMEPDQKIKFIESYFDDLNEDEFCSRLDYTGLNHVIKTVDKQILHRKRQLEILIGRFKKDINNEDFVNINITLNDTNNEILINKYKKFINRIKDIDETYDSNNMDLVINSFKSHMHKFVIYIELNNTNKNDIIRLEQYKHIINNFKDELDMDILNIKTPITTSEQKWKDNMNIKKDSVNWTFSELFGKLSKLFSNLQNNFYKEQINDMYSDVYENFPHNLKAKLNEAKDNGYKHMDELIDKALDNIIDCPKTSSSGPMICYETFGNEIFNNLLIYICCEVAENYSYDKIIKYYEKYLINIYYYLELKIGNDPSGIPYDCYCILLDDYLVNEYCDCEISSEFYYNLKIINKSYMNNKHINYREIIDYNDYFKNADNILNNIKFYGNLRLNIAPTID